MKTHQTIPDIATAAAQVDPFVERQRPALIQLCADLVAARSVNPPGQTSEAAAVVQAFLAERGVNCETLAKVEHKTNLIAQNDGAGSGRHLVFNGHLDTIPAGEESAWSVPIYELSQRDGKLYGIGMGNMKGAVAAMALAFTFLASRPELWRGRVSLTAVADETVFGPDGAQWLLEQRPELLGDALVCGEGPGSMGLAIAEKGVFWVELEARAPAGQGMLAQQGSSATTRLAAAVAELDRMNDDRATPPAEVALLAEHAGEHGLRLSVNVGTLSGGNFVSQAASRATATVDFRVPPGLTVAAIDGRLEDLCKRIPGLSYRHIKGWNPNWTAPDADIAQAIETAVTQVRGAPPKHVVRLPASDASRWRARGVPAICYGPQPLLASGVDDFAYEQDVVDCAKIYALAAIAYLNRV